MSTGRIELGAVCTVATVLVLGFLFMPGLLLSTAQSAAASLGLH